jgi:DNA-binding CsgD family transcriptional regulator
MAVTVAVVDRLAGAALVLDDLQWADEGTLAVAELLAGRVPIAVAVRDGDGLAPGVIARLRAAGYEAVRVPPLSARDGAAVIATCRPGLSERACEQLLARAGGNPLMITELARDGHVTSSFRLSLAARLRQLAPAAREDFELLALAGQPVPRNWLGPASLDALDAASLLSGDGTTVTVRHALLGDVAIDGLSPDERRERHAHLARLVTDDAQRARHLHAAGETSAARAAALDAAAASATPGERAEHLALAADCADGPDADALRLQAAEALEQTHSWQRLDGVLENLASTDPQLVARAELLRARGAWSAGRPEVVRASLRRGLSLVSGTGTDTEVLLRIEQCRVPIFLDGEVEEGIAAARAALELAEEQQVGVARAHYFLGTALGVAGRDGWEEHLALAIEAARRTPDARDTEFSATNNLVTFHEATGSPDKARVAGADGVRRAESQGLLGWATALRAMLVQLDLHAAAYQAVLEESERLLDLPIDQRARDTLHQTRGLALVDLGRLEEAEREVTGHLQHAAGDARGAPSLVLVLAEADLWGGRPRRAIEHAEQYVRALADDPHNRAFGDIVRGWAAFDLGEPVPPAPEVPDWAMLSAVSLELRGLSRLQVGEHLDATRLLDEAARAWAPYHARGELRCRWAAAEAVRRSGDTAEAVGRLERLESRLTVLGMRPLLGRVHRSLRACGRARRTSQGGSRSGLSARELEVLELAATGLTTPEIAVRLGIGRRAVAEHARRAVVKLGATNRAHAVALLHSAGPAAER